MIYDYLTHIESSFGLSTFISSSVNYKLSRLARLHFKCTALCSDSDLTETISITFFSRITPLWVLFKAQLIELI